VGILVVVEAGLRKASTFLSSFGFDSPPSILTHGSDFLLLQVAHLLLFTTDRSPAGSISRVERRPSLPSCISSAHRSCIERTLFLGPASVSRSGFHSRARNAERATNFLEFWLSPLARVLVHSSCSRFPPVGSLDLAAGAALGQLFLLPLTQLDFDFGAQVSVFARGLSFMLRARWPCFNPVAT
jgi:hypothetical protein